MLVTVIPPRSGSLSVSRVKGNTDRGGPVALHSKPNRLEQGQNSCS
jgi:hypothetical protein